MTGSGSNGEFAHGGDRRRERRSCAERRVGGARRNDGRHPHRPDGQRRGTNRPGEVIRRTTEDRRGSGDRRAAQ